MAAAKVGDEQRREDPTILARERRANVIRAMTHLGVDRRQIDETLSRIVRLLPRGGARPQPAVA